jgi:hypothetical protein
MATTGEAAVADRMVMAHRVMRAVLPIAMKGVPREARERWLQRVEVHWRWAYAILRQRYLLYDAGFLTPSGKPVDELAEELGIWAETKRKGGELADTLHRVLAEVIALRGSTLPRDTQTRAALRRELIVLLGRCGDAPCRPYDTDHS